MILIIDNYDSFTYNLFQLFAQYYPDIKVVRNDAITLGDIKKLNPKGIVLSPGPGFPKDAGICIDLIKEFYRSIPILGVCLGHQALVAAFGGSIIHAEEIVHGKTASVFHTRTGFFKDLSLPLIVGRYHSLIAEKKSMPKELVIEAETGNGVVMSVKHTEFDCYGVQFHPESILTPEGNKIAKRFLKICKAS